MPYEPVRDVRRMSMLLWAEHCVECAAPECYQSCDLYQPRTDKRCRRFTFGSMKNRSFASLRDYGVEISFKKWAKLEAYGNLSLLPIKAVLWGEWLIEWVAPAGNFIGGIMGKLTRKLRWSSATMVAMEELVRRLDFRKDEQKTPDVFLLEVYNPSAAAVRMQLSFTPVKRISAGQTVPLESTPSFVSTLNLPNGYSRHEVELSLLTLVMASSKHFIISMIPEADTNARLVFLTADFVQFSAQRAEVRESKKVKCLVWDLDNTLWSGTLAEGDEVAPRPEIASLLKELDERGVLLSIASKNDYGAAWRKLEECGLSKYFVSPQINWAPKSQNIRAIAERLNLGLDSFAFVEDSPFELDEVARSLPGVVCLNAREIPSLISDPRFQGNASAESRRRRQFYQEADLRNQARTQFGSDYLGFLAACGITLEISPYTAEEADRVAELVQRTNQLNFSGRKYSRSQLEAILAESHIEKLVLRSSDRYGSYGTVGFALVEWTGGMIRLLDFMLSCRVQGKLLEQAFFSHLFEHHNPAESSRLWVNFQETSRNKPAQHVLESLGFHSCVPTAGGIAAGMLCASRDSLRCDFIKVHCTVGLQEARAGTSLAPDSTPVGSLNARNQLEGA